MTTATDIAALKARCTALEKRSTAIEVRQTNQAARMDKIEAAATALAVRVAVLEGARPPLP